MNRPVTFQGNGLVLHLDEEVGQPIALTMESTIISSDLTVATIRLTRLQEEALRTYLNLRRWTTNRSEHRLSVDSAMTIDCSCGFWDNDYNVMTDHIWEAAIATAFGLNTPDGDAPVGGIEQFQAEDR